MVNRSGSNGHDSSHDDVCGKQLQMVHRVKDLHPLDWVLSGKESRPQDDNQICTSFSSLICVSSLRLPILSPLVGKKLPESRCIGPASILIREGGHFYCIGFTSKKSIDIIAGI